MLRELRIAFMGVCFLGGASQAFGAACAAGWAGTGTCYPDPTYFTSDLGVSGNYLVCGPGRVALTGDGNYTWSGLSSTDKPLSDTATGSYTWSDGNSYSYLRTLQPTQPLYGYPENTRCYCLKDDNTGTVPGGVFPANAPAWSSSSGGFLRQYPVTFDTISAASVANPTMYGPVPVARNKDLDGRIYDTIANGNNGGAKCSCPNINEQAITNIPGQPSGTHCMPLVSGNLLTSLNSNAALVLTPFNNAIHNGQILTSEYPDNVNPTAIIQLPNSALDQVGLTSYARRIWTCASPYDLNQGTSPATCQFIQAKHACDDGSGGGGSIASPVDSSTNAMTSYATQFNNVVNKKLACCMNAFRTTVPNTDTYEKFDCVENPITNTATNTVTGFNNLWAGMDAEADGGQLYAVLLAGSAKVDTSATQTTSGKPNYLSGFYTLDGNRCNQFSEFSFQGGIQPMKVMPLQSDGQTSNPGAAVVANGAPYPVPTSAKYTAIGVGLETTIPTTQKDYLRCPILVRAAMVAACPAMTVVPNQLKTIFSTATATLAGPGRCSAAAGIQIHIRIEQIYEIAGAAPIKPVDTLVDVNSTTAVDVGKIIADKVGNLCPPGTIRNGDHCGY